jgi:hypothetical protein
VNTLPTILSCSLLILGVSCRVQVHERSVGESTVPLTTALPTRAFEVVEHGEVVGVVVEFTETGGGRRFFSIRNESQQELGMVDDRGRYWRFRAHWESTQDGESEWIGTGTVLNGATLILGLGNEIELYEVSIGQLVAPGDCPPGEAR